MKTNGLKMSKNAVLKLHSDGEVKIYSNSSTLPGLKLDADARFIVSNDARMQVGTYPHYGRYYQYTSLRLDKRSTFVAGHNSSVQFLELRVKRDSQVHIMPNAHFKLGGYDFIVKPGLHLTIEQGIYFVLMGYKTCELLLNLTIREDTIVNLKNSSNNLPPEFNCAARIELER